MHVRRGGRHKKVAQKCIAKLTGSPVRITSRVAATLSRDKVIYATGSAIVSVKKTTLLLTQRRRIGKGSYTLTLTHGHKRQHETITID
ncbi:MAG: hypothetical protein WB507_10080 [Solirubrobacterales bacterium]